jgi:hypothetical protein
MNLIKDREEFNKLISILPDLNKDEVYFISLSARNKYLTMDERKEYSLGQTEMFGREIAQSKEKLYDYTIKKLEATLSYKTTRNGKPIPDKSLICYVNINPSSMVKAYYQFQKEMNNQMSEITLALLHGKDPNYSFINIQTRELMNCIQKSTGTKHFIDIDCDTKEPEVLDYFKEAFLNCLIEYYIIETKGGYHFLLKKDTFPVKYNLQKIIDDGIIRLERIIYEKQLNNKIEIMINGNGMIPVPGIMQSDHLVKFVNI